MRFQQLLAGVAMGAALAASPGAFAADMFLKIDGIEGESVFKGHEKEIDVLAWSWGASSTGTWNKPGCASVQDISFTKNVDKASPKLLAAVASGLVIPSAKLSVRKSGEATRDFLVLEMSNVLVSSVSTGGSSGEQTPIESVALNFASMKFTYTPQRADGSGGTPVIATITGTCRK